MQTNGGLGVTAVSDPNQLGEIPLFDGIPADRLKRLNEVMHRKTVPAGTNMITAEQPGEVVYVLLDGTVKILIEQMDGREVILAFLGAGDTVLLEAQLTLACIDLEKMRAIRLPPEVAAACRP